jgi:Fur family ferric uptake transcriptional regulator
VDVRTWERRLAEAGCRITTPRRAVIEVLLETDEPLSAQEIHERGRALHPSLGLVTVYRSLELFEELELVSRVHCGHDCHGYVTSSPGHHHQVVCQGCGRTAEFPGTEDLGPLITQVERNTNYRVEDHLLQLFGLCPACRRT